MTQQKPQLPQYGQTPNEAIAERDELYGGFHNNAVVTKILEAIIEEHWQGEKPTEMQAYALDMFCIKIARIVCGDAKYLDNWRDISAYSKLVMEYLDPEHPRGK